MIQQSVVDLCVRLNIFQTTLFNMDIIAYILFSIGFVIALFYYLKIVRTAYHESVFLGVSVLLIPVIMFLPVVAVHWSDTKPDFLKFLISIPFTMAGVFLFRGGV